MLYPPSSAPSNRHSSKQSGNSISKTLLEYAAMLRDTDYKNLSATSSIRVLVQQEESSHKFYLYLKVGFTVLPPHLRLQTVKTLHLLARCSQFPNTLFQREILWSGHRQYSFAVALQFPPTKTTYKIHITRSSAVNVRRISTNNSAQRKKSISVDVRPLLGIRCPQRWLVATLMLTPIQVTSRNTISQLDNKCSSSLHLTSLYVTTRYTGPPLG